MWVLKPTLLTLNLCKLNAEQVDMLEAPISEDDITLALTQVAKPKAPGSDVRPNEFHVHFSDILIPRFIMLYLQPLPSLILCGKLL